MKNKPTLLEKLNYAFGTNTNDLSKVKPEKIIEYAELTYKLKTTAQTNSKNKRYYYKSNYLLTAPESLKHELTVEFNRLMNAEPKVSLENIIQDLKFYKDMLLNEENLITSSELGLEAVFS